MYSSKSRFACEAVFAISLYSIPYLIACEIDHKCSGSNRTVRLGQVGLLTTNASLNTALHQARNMVGVRRRGLSG
jgi:hypothetical protein